MKRLIIIALVLLPALLNAGVILKKSGQRLEEVSIKSVTDTEIVYTTLDGAETSIQKSEVSAVLYDDGRYEEIRQATAQNNYNNDDNAFAVKVERELSREQQDSIWQAQAEANRIAKEHKQFVADSIKAAKLAAAALAYQIADSLQQAKKAEAALAREQRRQRQDSIWQAQAEAYRIAQEHKQFVADSIQQAKIAHEESIKNLSRYSITKVSNREFVCNGTKLNRKEYQQLLMLNCPDAYVKYKKGTTNIAVGWTLFCLGLAGGATMYALWETTDIEETPTIIGGATSGALLLASIPIIGTGHGRHKKALNMYNSQCVSQDAKLSLNFGATRNGMGLTLNW